MRFFMKRGSDRVYKAERLIGRLADQIQLGIHKSTLKESKIRLLLLYKW